MFKTKTFAAIISLSFVFSLLLSATAFAQDADATSTDASSTADEQTDADSTTVDDKGRQADEAEDSTEVGDESSSAEIEDSKKGKLRKPIVKPRIKRDFTKLHPFPKGEARNQSFYVFLQWGALSKYNKNAQQVNWDIDLSVSGGKISLVGEPVLFEKNDEINEQGDPSKLSGITGTSTHWDGVIVRITPSEVVEDATVNFKIGDFSKSYGLRELFSVHGIYELDNGKEVAVRAFNKGGYLDADTRNTLFNRKFALLKRIHKVHEKAGELLDEGKLESDMADDIFNVLKRLENHQYAEKSDIKWINRINTLLNKLNSEGAKVLPKELGALESDFMDACNKNADEDFVEGITPFDDTSQCAWYTDFVRRLKSSDVVKGKAGTNHFDPGSDISRAELLAISLAGAGIDVDHVPDNEVADNVFADSNNHWAERGIRYAVQQGLVQGYEDGFRPNKPVTRAEALAMVYKIFGLNAGDVCNGDQFNDVKDHWGCAIMEDAKIVGIVNGFGDGTFKPNKPISRAEMAKVVSNVIDYIQETGDFDEL